MIVDKKLLSIAFLSQNWKGWERSGEQGLIISDNQAQTCLIITINDTSTGDLPLIITISDTCKNQTKRLDFDNTINLSSLIVSLALNLCPFPELPTMIPPHRPKPPLPSHDHTRISDSTTGDIPCM